MSGIKSRGRRGFTVVPNWRWEDLTLDSYELRVAGWIASHADSYAHDHVTRNEITRCTGISAGKVSLALKQLSGLRIISTETVPRAKIGGTRLCITFDWDVWEIRPAVTT